MKKAYFLFLFIVPVLTYSQFITPNKEPLFIDTEIPQIFIKIDQASLNQILEDGNENSNTEYAATFIFKSSQITDTIENVGFRLRGNTSRYSAKKSFKISFNTFTEGGDYYGLEKMNINGEHNDPSIIRSKISWDIMREFGVPAPRSNHVELYINDEYKGLYINVEHIDEEFAELRFGNKDGNLYKCLYPASLDYIDDNPDSYKLTSGDRRIYELKTNTVTDDYSDIAEFIDIINNTPISQMPEKLEPVFNINLFLKFHAVEVFTAHWDSYSYLSNNYYLYKNTATGKIEFIPYDMDNTFGIDWFGEEWATRDMYNWISELDPRPLISNVLQNPTYKERYSYYMNQLIEQVVDLETYLARIDDIKTMIQSSAENDVYRTYDYGWSYNDFLNSYENALGDHVKYGLIEYLTERHESASQQINLQNISPIIYYTENSIPALNSELSINCAIEDESSEIDITLTYQINGSEQEISMSKINDSQIQFYQSNILIDNSGTFNYYITATDTDNNSTRYPVVGTNAIDIPDTESTGLYINELMASNTNAYADENNEYDDWIELYNDSDNAIWLGDYYLTDNYDIQNKFKLPDENLNSKNFVIVWADNDVEQGIYHAPFKLSKDGEEAVLFIATGTTYSLIDHVPFGPLETDVSFGKLPDGNGIPTMLSPTPGSSNMILSIHENIIDAKVNCFPNPFHESLTIESEDNIRSVSILSLYGQEVFQKSGNGQTIQVNPQLFPGIYLLKITTDTNEIFKKIISN